MNPYLFALGQVVVEVPKERGTIHLCPDDESYRRSEISLLRIRAYHFKRLVDSTSKLFKCFAYEPFTRAKMRECLGIANSTSISIATKLVDLDALSGDLINGTAVYVFTEGVLDILEPP